jgi:hypothetical protein
MISEESDVDEDVEVVPLREEREKKDGVSFARRSFVVP